MNTNELLVNCISMFLNNETQEAPQGTNWPELIQKAEQQKLLPMVYEVFGASMPENMRKDCRSSVVHSIIVQSGKTSEFLETYKELRKSGIYPVIVKGIMCAYTYDKPDYRISADEDLYIPLESYPAFHEKMLAMGFDAKEPDYKNAHELRYTRNNLLIEGHWELFPKENDVLNALNVHSKVFLSRAQYHSIDGVELKTLEPTDHMIFLLFHAYKHFISSGVGVRQICDIAQWAKYYELDWTRIKHAMKSVRGECFAAAIFDAGEKYFGMSFPDAWEKADCTALLGDALNGGIYGTSKMSRKHSASMTLEAVDASGKGKNGAPLMKAIFPNRIIMEMSYPWVRKSIVFLPIAWGTRIIRYIVSKEMCNSASESIKIGSERIELMKQYKIIQK